MEAFLQRLISASLSMSAVALPLLLCTPWLSRRYRQKALYLMTLILTLAFLFMPLRPHFTKAVITLPAPSETVQQPSPALSANAKTLQTPSDLSTAHYTEEHVQAQETLLSPASAQKSYTHPAAVPLSLIVPEKAPVSLTASQILSAGYLLTAGGMLLYHLIRHARFMRLVRRWQSKPLGGCYQVILDEEKARMGVKRTLTLHLCPAVPSPMLVGVKRPRILLPDETLDEQALRMVLRHEMTHMVRMDIPFKFLSLLSLCLHWFNPIMYLLQRKMNYLCETSCDEAVLKSASWTDVERYTRTITLTTQDSIGFVTVYQQRSVDSTPVNAYQKGTQLQVIGRQSGWYHVSIDGVTGYVQAENAILSPEGEKLFDNQLFRFEGFLDSSLLGEGEKRDTYNRLLEQAFETYGEEKSYWTLEQKAWYSQLTRDYGYLSQGENVNILPNDHDISQEEALKKALEHIQKELNTQLDIQWFTITYSLYYNWGEGEENAFWAIRFWPMNRMLGRYVVTMDRQGNLVNDIYTDIPESEQKVLDTWGTLYDFDQFIMANPGVNPEDVLSEEVLEAWAQWVGDTAPYADYGVQDESVHSQAVSAYGNNNYFWPLDVRVAAFGGSNSIPQPGELTEEEAKAMAVQAIINERGQEALDALGEYKTGAILERFNEGTEEEYTRWMIFVTDDPDIFLNGYRVTLSQRPGQGVEGSPTVQTLDDTSNG